MATDKKVALVTGGSRGIGFGVAQELARSGFDIAINGRRPTGDVADAFKQLESLGAAVLYCRADVASADDRARMLSEIEQRFSRLDVLVNNAGVAPEVRADILDATEQSFDRLININLKGPYFLTQSAAKWMIRQRASSTDFRGCIVSVSSVSATVASTNRGDYCIRQAGIAVPGNLGAPLSADSNSDVWEVRPGVIATHKAGGGKEKYDKLFEGGRTVEKRGAPPADVGKA